MIEFLAFVCRLYASLGKERFRIISAAEKYAQAFFTDKQVEAYQPIFT